MPSNLFGIYESNPLGYIGPDSGTFTSELAAAEKALLSMNDEKEKVAKERDNCLLTVEKQAVCIVEQNQQIVNYQKRNETVLKESRRIEEENVALHKRISARDHIIKSHCDTAEKYHVALRLSRMILVNLANVHGDSDSPTGSDIIYTYDLITKLLDK